jgi:hypothetical protein
VGMILGCKCRSRPSCILGIHERIADEPYGCGLLHHDTKEHIPTGSANPLKQNRKTGLWLLRDADAI